MENNETALMVDKGDSRALADKIIYLLKNKTASDSMAENAFKKYNAFFTREIMIKNTAD